MSLVSQAIVSASAMVTASATVAGAAYLREVRRTVAENEERSERNRAMLTGEGAPHYEGLLHRVRSVEQEVLDD